MYLQSETYQLILCLVTLALTLTAGFMLGMLINEREPDRPRRRSAIPRN
ncbi:hypothetical protein GCM10027578_00880 [Spirosoma luteolum]